MLLSSRLMSVAVVLWLPSAALFAEPPVASYIFPAGGQRGKDVETRVGGLNLHKSCSFEMLGPGVHADTTLHPMKTTWFDGPLLHLPESQQAEDYPRDMGCKIAIAPDATLGIRYCQLTTSQGATAALRFQIGELPEVIEAEMDGTPMPAKVSVPVTINGRIFPRENVDIWSFEAHKGQKFSCEVWAARLGSPLDSYLELFDPHGRKIAENDDFFGSDSCIRFTASEDGAFQVRIRDVNLRGGQSFVYRLSITDAPRVDFTYPLGGRRGSKVALILHGANVPAEPVEVALPGDGPGEYTHPLSLGGKAAVPVLLDLDDLPEHLEAEPNDDSEQVKPVAVPAVLNGRIDKPGDVDYWAFTMTKGQVLEFELRAARLGSRLDGVVTILDATGKELANSQNMTTADPTLQITAPADGTFRVRIADRFRKRGGPDFGYRLRVAPPPAPDFALQAAADSLTLPRGAAGKLKVTAERRGGFAGPIDIAIDNLPAGVTVAGATIPANQLTADITFKTEADARIQHARLSLRGTAKINEQPVSHTAVVPAARGLTPLDSVLLAVAMPTPFKVVGDYDMRWAPRGSVHARKYRLERNGYEGPLEVRLADRQARHLQGVMGPTITVPAGANEFDYNITLPPWMETGRTCRVCVMAVGIVKDKDGTEHEVSFTSLNQNEQLVAVIEPGRLNIELGKQALVVSPGNHIDLDVKVLRGKGLEGPAKVELVLAEHVHGISTVAITVPAEKTDGMIRIQFDKGQVGPLNAAAIVRATIMDGGKPVVAEARLELLPAK